MLKLQIGNFLIVGGFLLLEESFSISYGELSAGWSDSKVEILLLIHLLERNLFKSCSDSIFLKMVSCSLQFGLLFLLFISFIQCPEVLGSLSIHSGLVDLDLSVSKNFFSFLVDFGLI
jgi:hypothetical protein